MEIYLCPQLHIATIFLIEFGRYYNLIYLGKKVNGAASRKITEDFSTQCFGFCVPARHGVIYRPIMGNGIVLRKGFGVGWKADYGKIYLKRL